MRTTKLVAALAFGAVVLTAGCSGLGGGKHSSTTTPGGGGGNKTLQASVQIGAGIGPRAVSNASVTTACKKVGDKAHYSLSSAGVQVELISGNLTQPAATFLINGTTTKIASPGQPGSTKGYTFQGQWQVQQDCSLARLEGKILKDGKLFAPVTIHVGAGSTPAPPVKVTPTTKPKKGTTPTTKKKP